MRSYLSTHCVVIALFAVCSTAAECATDFRLVWDNCKLYNKDNRDFFELGVKLSKKFEVSAA